MPHRVPTVNQSAAELKRQVEIERTGEPFSSTASRLVSSGSCRSPGGRDWSSGGARPSTSRSRATSSSPDSTRRSSSSGAPGWSPTTGCRATGPSSTESACARDVASAIVTSSSSARRAFSSGTRLQRPRRRRPGRHLRGRRSHLSATSSARSSSNFAGPFSAVALCGDAGVQPDDRRRALHERRSRQGEPARALREIRSRRPSAEREACISGRAGAEPRRRPSRARASYSQGFALGPSGCERRGEVGVAGAVPH